MIPAQLDITDLPWKLIIFIGIFFGLRAYFRGPKCHIKKTLNDKIAIVTGANIGIGFEIVKDLYVRGALVVMACRDVVQGEKARKQIMDETKLSKEKRLIVKRLDLGSMKSIRQFCADIDQDYDHVDILINNAGTMMHPSAFTSDGIEIHFAVNYLGHFLLTLLLLKKLFKSAQGKIVNVSSIAHKLGSLDLASVVGKIGNGGGQYNQLLPSQKVGDGNLDGNGVGNMVSTHQPREYYAMSKLAMILWTRRMGKMLEGSTLRINACHPGLAFTNIMRYMPFHTNSFLYATSFPFLWFFTKTARDGAQTPIFCAIDDEYLKGVNGKYLSDCQLSEPGLNAKDDAMAEVLWEESLKLCSLPANFDPLGEISKPAAISNE